MYSRLITVPAPRSETSRLHQVIGGRSQAPPAGRRPLACLAVRLVLAAERAVLAQFKPVGVVAPVFPRDVVAVLAFLAGQGDLGPDISRSHVARLSLVQSSEARKGGTARGVSPEAPGASVIP